MQKTPLLIVVGAVLALGGCGGADGPANGVQRCAPEGSVRRCPEGYACQSDDRCWRTGTGPEVATDASARDGAARDANTPDVRPGGQDGPGPNGTDGGDKPDVSVADRPPDVFIPMASVPSPSGMKQVPGGVRAQSPSYVLVKTSGQPSSGRVMESTRYRLVRGLVGATQR